MNKDHLNLLIIDDNQDDQKIYKRYLKKSENFTFDFFEAYNGNMALEIIQKERVDCILLDYLLPDTDGVKLIKQIEEQFPEKFLPVIAITGEGTEDIAANFIKSGAKEYLRKDNISTFSLSNAIMSAIGIAKLNQKVTEQQREILQKNTELKNVNAYLQDFCHTVAHDLKEPLNLIQSLLGLMLKSIQDKSDIGLSPEDVLNRVIRSSERMRNLITDLLNYAENTKKKSQTEIINLNHILRDVCHDLEVKIKDHQVKIDIQTLPEIQGNRSQIYQIFLNLINNAIKFSRPEPMPHIQVKTEELDQQSCQIIVQDNGIGIPKEHQEKIFKPFQRLHSKDKYEGSGIGLTTIIKILEFHGGSISIESEVDQGTTFTMTLPYRQVEDLN